MNILIVDGDFVSKGWVGALLSRVLGMKRPIAEGGMAERHADILSRVHFSSGARAESVATGLRAGAAVPDQ